jgi:hypothetical protein
LHDFVILGLDSCLRLALNDTNHQLLRGMTMHKLELLGIALIGVAMASQSALATTIDVTYSGSANFGSRPVGFG